MTPSDLPVCSYCSSSSREAHPCGRPVHHQAPGCRHHPVCRPGHRRAHHHRGGPLQRRYARLSLVFWFDRRAVVLKSRLYFVKNIKRFVLCLPSLFGAILKPKSDLWDTWYTYSTAVIFRYSSISLPLKGHSTHFHVNLYWKSVIFVV